MQPVLDNSVPKELTPSQTTSLSTGTALILAGWFGLVGGYLDLGMIFLKRDLFHVTLYYELGRHFCWMVPVAHLAVMLVLGLWIAGVNWLRKGLISLRSAFLVYATLATWGPLWRAPLYSLATLFAAVGAARLISRPLARHARGFHQFAWPSLIVLLVLVAATAANSLRQQSRAESRAIAQLPAPPAGAGNVLLIVMDTVRASSLGLYGYDRDTSPHLSRWAKRGVRFDWALGAAPWTFPSHCSFLTGQWPSTLGADWEPVVNPSYPTLAEVLSTRGYITAGFAANTHWCSYESGMNRGFAHYEDYPLTPSIVLGTTGPGRWLVENLRHPRDYYSVKWIRSQSRDAAQINRSFLDWLSRNELVVRPFFAFLNYLQPTSRSWPDDEGVHFGRRPESRGDYRMLLEYWDRNKLELGEHDVELARDSYDNCIAALDRQIGLMLDELDPRGVLRDTLVIITSDHGEQFGEHGVFNHGFSLYTQEVHVPLLIIGPSVPPGQTVSDPVSLRDLPATVVDLLGLGRASTFPGRSLAESWPPNARVGHSSASTALSEVDIPTVIAPERGRGPIQRGFTTSLVENGLHYLLDARGTEELYDLASDSQELRDLRNTPGRETALDDLRNALARILRDHHPSGGVAAAYLKQLLRILGSMIPPPSI